MSVERSEKRTGDLQQLLSDKQRQLDLAQAGAGGQAVEHMGGDNRRQEPPMAYYPSQNLPSATATQTRTMAEQQPLQEPPMVQRMAQSSQLQPPSDFSLPPPTKTNISPPRQTREKHDPQPYTATPQCKVWDRWAWDAPPGSQDRQPGRGDLPLGERPRELCADPFLKLQAQSYMSRTTDLEQPTTGRSTTIWSCQNSYWCRKIHYTLAPPCCISRRQTGRIRRIDTVGVRIWLPGLH